MPEAEFSIFDDEVNATQIKRSNVRRKAMIFNT
jgi:hypothetical protein